jgi:beta-lactamase superfamily II metal-dependent hydrolase
MPGQMRLNIWDVRHGACAMIQHINGNIVSPLAMIDSGCTDEWCPSDHITNVLGRNRVDYLFITNADQDHMSDLDGLWEAGIEVGGVYRNTSYTSSQYRQMKLAGGPLTNDAERYAMMCDWTHNGTYPAFNAVMGGIIEHRFWPDYSRHRDTNNLSMAVFFEYAGFKILFPGDLEEAGWRDLLAQPAFCQHLASTTILVASHHGRENGYVEDVFRHCRPQAVVMSDKGIEHETQMARPLYHARVADNYPDGIVVLNDSRRRFVLTTNADGHIGLTVYDNGRFVVSIEHGR